MTKSHLQHLTEASQVYGQRAFDNYAQIRSIAETLRDGFCEWMDNKEQCVFLVPPKGEFTSQNYGSAAFSVSGASFLPLEPIAFGLPVIFGEKYQKFEEANWLVENGGGFTINDLEGFEKIIQQLQEADFYKKAAKKAAQYIEENRGATEKILFQWTIPRFRDKLDN